MLDQKHTILCLNIWGGKILDPLLNFLHSYRHIDIFCFQEVFSKTHQKVSPSSDGQTCLDVFERIATILPDHQGFFTPIIDGVYGLGSFIRKDIVVLKTGEDWIDENLHYSGQGPSHSRKLQWFTLQLQQQLSVVNLHGLWNGQGKTDSAAREEQSLQIKQCIRQLQTPIVLCGDFNLMPDTQSIKILEKDMQNFISIKNIASTRSSFYKKSERYADYIFMTPDLYAHDFQVLADEVSDHLPLYAEFSFKK